MTEPGPRNVQSDAPMADRGDKGRASNGGSSENLAAPSPLDRGRSMSPVQTVSTTAAQSRSASGAMTHRGQPAEAPTTPRHPAGSELRLGIVVAELQRQGAEDRRLVQRQLDHLERRLQARSFRQSVIKSVHDWKEQLGMPASRERWADLQGSVTGLLEEVAGLVRRVEGLDEKLRTAQPKHLAVQDGVAVRIRTASCEELLRQRTREVEQQVHSQQQKVQLAVSTFEETCRMPNNPVRREPRCQGDVQAPDRQAPQSGTNFGGANAATSLSRGSFPAPCAGLVWRSRQGRSLETWARLSELEGQQASLEEEFRNVVTTGQRLDSLSPSRRLPGSSVHTVHAEGPGYDVVRALETELSTLSKQLAAQLDDHSSALASLRVRTEGQEILASERLEKVVAPTLEAFRAEMQQLRLADRSEMDQRFEHLS
eukprot:s4931_g1.t1